MKPKLPVVAPLELEQLWREDRESLPDSVDAGAVYSVLAGAAAGESAGPYRDRLLKRLRAVDREILATIAIEHLRPLGAADHDQLLPTHATAWQSPTARAAFAIAGDAAGPPTAWSLGIRGAGLAREDLEQNSDGVWIFRRRCRRAQPADVSAALGAGPPQLEAPASGAYLRFQLGAGGKLYFAAIEDRAGPPMPGDQ